MDGNIEVYTKEDCGQCVTIKNMLKSKSIEYTEGQIRPDNTQELVSRSDYLARSAPICFVDNVYHSQKEMINYIQSL